ncbi:MAG: hypothetical protein RL077_2763 [Verrucomicrobiota bacterium]|jgi:cytochrome c553
MFSSSPYSRLTLTAVITLTSVMVASAAEPIDFSRQIMPILADACFRCHGPDAGARKAKLRLDQREGLFRTHDDVTVVVPGQPAVSELILRITSKEADEVMPPPDSSRQLKPAEIELLRRWVASGAAWGTHWAFQPPSQPTPPKVAKGALARRVRNPIDPFIFARLEQAKLTPAPEATRAALIRRVTFDLTGLPPSPAEVTAFLDDRGSDAYERVVDRLLASPRYGERWAWDWLDLARYADTNGFQGDPERTMWPWRDWVVNALNANMPFDQFTIEQLAGDLLPAATRDQKLATGFHRNNMFNGEGGRIAEETRVENVFDRVETTATVWLGATFTCARCHDHKYDPITQRDYFALYDIFNQMSETGSASGGGRSGQILPALDMSTDEERARVKTTADKLEEIAKGVEAFELNKFPRPEGKTTFDSPVAQKLPGNLPVTLAKTAANRRGVDSLLEAIPHFKTTDPDPEYAALLQKLLNAVRARDAAANGVTKVMIMDELPKRRDTFILNKGNYESKTDVKVVGAIPSRFARTRAAPSAPGGDRAPVDPAPPPFNRLDLARWLVSPENPLAARVAMNRAWQAFFGTGLVKTAEDFGMQSEPPSHPELLDWLATEFVTRGWDVKALHRLMVTSATYRQSSRVSASLQERDPENRLLARGPRYRLPSWMLRDQALAAAGLLVAQAGGQSVKPYQPAGIWEEATFGKKTYKQDHDSSLYRRSLYVFWRRIVGPPTFFDAGARQVCTVKVARTNTPLHALVTLNDTAFVEAARVLAQVTTAAAVSEADRLNYAFRVLTSRLPTKPERTILLGRLVKLRAQFAADPAAARQLAAVGEAARPESLDPVEHAAWTALCSLLFNLDETLSKE